MKKQKVINPIWLSKTLSVVLAVLILAATYIVPTSAAELTSDGTAPSTVSHTVDAVFTASIPAYVVPTEQGEASVDYTVSVDNAVIPDSHELTAKVEYSGSMTEQNGVELPYVLTDATGNTVVSGSKILTKTAGAPNDLVSVSFGAALTDKARYAGVYMDTATFSFEIEEKVYTLDDINADEHLFAIGKTKPEYVVARFNEDYTEVTIFKNGEDSDGKMCQILELNGTGYWEYMYFKGLSGYEIEVLSNVYEILGEQFIFYVTENEAPIDCTIKSGVTDISKSFLYYCNLNTLVIPDTVKTIGSLTASNVKNLIIAEGVEEIDTLAFVHLNDSGGTSDVNIPKTMKRIGDWAFYGSIIKDATIPEGVEYIGEGAFARSSITSAVVPGTVKEIKEHAFEDCYYLTDIKLNYGIEVIRDNAFSTRSGQKKQMIDNLFIPGSVKIIGTCAFAHNNISNIRLSEGLEDIGIQAFSSNDFKSIKVPDSVTVVGREAFYNCKELETVAFGDNVTSLGEQAFSDCSALKNVTLPKSITELQPYTFSGCSSLTSIVIPENITSLGNCLFYNCKSLESVTIPEGVTFIPISPAHTPNLTTVYGISGSYAETWASKNGYTFVAQ